VKNASSYLPNFLQQIENLDYPKDKIRLLFVYGESQDNTLEILKNCKLNREVYAEQNIWRGEGGPELLADAWNDMCSICTEDYFVHASADLKYIPPDILQRLIAHDKDIVAPFTYIENTNKFFDTYVFRIRGQRFPENIKLEGLTEVDSVGTFMVIKKKVIEQVKWENPHPPLQFCHNARKKGFKVYVDPSIAVIHPLPTMVWNPRFVTDAKRKVEDVALYVQKGLFTYDNLRHMRIYINGKDLVHRASFLGTEKEEPIDVIMLSYNNLELTRQAIESLYAHTNYPFRLIVVDNASDDGTQEYLKSLKYPNLTLVLEQERDSGYCEGMNKGLKEVKSEIYGVVQNDMIFFEDNWLRELVLTINSDPKIGIVSCKLLYPDGTIQFGGGTFDQFGNWYHVGRGKPKLLCSTLREIPATTSALMLVRKQAFSHFDESYIGVASWNDIDMSLRVRQAGWKIVYCPFAEVIHLESKTALADMREFQKQWTNNSKLFYSRWLEFLKKDMQEHPELYIP